MNRYTNKTDSGQYQLRDADTLCHYEVVNRVGELEDLLEALEAKAPQPGSRVYVVEREEDGEAYDTSGYLLLAVGLDVAVCTSVSINGDKRYDTMKNSLISDTRTDYVSSVSIFPLSDVFSCKKKQKLNLV